MTLQINLPAELEALLQNQVKAGGYSDVNDVILDALRSFFTHETELSQQELAVLRDDVQNRRENIKTGKEHWVDGEDFFARMERKFQ